MEQDLDLKTISNEERVKLIQAQRKKEQYKSSMLSIAGVLGFIIFWQVIAISGLIESKYLSTPIQIVSLFITKLTNPNPDGAVIGLILSPV